MTFERRQWFALPLALRQRWWRETDYGRVPPSDELKLATGLTEPGAAANNQPSGPANADPTSNTADAGKSPAPRDMGRG
jgi:hypothetical protein